MVVAESEGVGVAPWQGGDRGEGDPCDLVGVGAEVEEGEPVGDGVFADAFHPLAVVLVRDFFHEGPLYQHSPSLLLNHFIHFPMEGEVDIVLGIPSSRDRQQGLLAPSVLQPPHHKT